MLIWGGVDALTGVSIEELLLLSSERGLSSKIGIGFNWNGYMLFLSLIVGIKAVDTKLESHQSLEFDLVVDLNADTTTFMLYHLKEFYRFKLLLELYFSSFKFSSRSFSSLFKDSFS